MEFKTIQISDKKIFDEYYSKGYYESSKHNFTNFFMWRNFYDVHWKLEDDILFIASINRKNFRLWQPVCSSDKIQTAIDKIIQYKKSFTENKNFTLFAVEKSFAEELKNYPNAEFEFELNQNISDYVYRVEDLINLSGRKYHSKKNHLNSFRNNYPQAKYLKLNEELIPKCREQLEDWYENKSTEMHNDHFLALEHSAINEIFDNFAYFNIKGGAIELDGRIIAFTFGEQLNDDTAVIHIEKANPEIRGAYPAINHDFVANEWSDMKFINREEDMGLENLRKAKQSYKPIKMIEKFNAVIK